MGAESLSSNHSTQESELRREICLAGRLLYDRGFIAASEGNLSIRLNASRILTTPRGACKGSMAVDDLVVTDLEGQSLSSDQRASSEVAMHLLIYSLRPDVSAVCHCHPPIATGFASAGRALDQALHPEMVVTLGCVPLAPYATPGTSALGAALAPFVPHHDGILMANHGVVTYGANLLIAFRRMETVEHLAKISLVAELLGTKVLLTEHEVELLRNSRKQEHSPHSQITCNSVPRNAPTRADFSSRELETFIQTAFHGQGASDKGPSF